MTNETAELGAFIDDGVAYRIRTNRMPDDWFNVHVSTNGHNHYYSLISQTGQGISYARKAEGLECTFTAGLLKTVYLRDADTGETWSPAGYPIYSEVEDYDCVYTQHDTTITSVYKGIRVQLRYFVPRAAMHEIWGVEVENVSGRPRRIEVMPYAPVSLATFPRGNIRHQDCRFLPVINGQFARCFSPARPKNWFNAFLVASHPVSASRGNSMGLFHGIYTAAKPDIPAAFEPAHEPGYAYSLCVFLRNLVELKAGASERLHYAFGVADSVEAAGAVAAILRDPDAVDRLRQEVRDEYRRLAENIRVKTGEPKRDAIFNIWIKKQMRSYLSFKNHCRDNLQIDMAYSMIEPEYTIENAVDLIGFQYLDGHLPHSCRPLNPTHYSDKPTWLLMTFPELVKETGDFSVLERPAPFLRPDGMKTQETKPVWEHLILTMRHLEQDVGPHGISNMHHADWNDGLDSLSGSGESTLTALMFCHGLREFAALARRMGEDRVAAEAEDIYARMAARLNTVCWDGEWYNRGFSATGRSIGSRACKEGKLFLNPQSWAVISGVADAERTRTIMEQVDRHLETDLGMNLVYPLFTAYDPDLGTMSANPPGIAENGVYIHAGAFKLMADCLAGRPEQAWRLLHKILPDHPDNPLRQSRCLPFAVTNSWRGTEGCHYGLTGSAWRTGSSGWVYRAMIEFILGVRRGYDGLIIDPCLPSSQQEAFVERVYRGRTYRIQIENRDGRCCHVSRIEVNGRPTQGNVLPLDPQCHEYHVNVMV